MKYEKKTIVSTHTNRRHNLIFQENMQTFNEVNSKVFEIPVKESTV